MSKKSICSAPSIGVAIIGQTFNPCCWTKDNFFLKKNYKSIRELQSKFFKPIQEELKTHLPDRCEKCKFSQPDRAYYNHFNELESLDVNQEYVPKLKHLHVMFNNKCNLACRICSSQFSSLHHKEKYGKNKVTHTIEPGSHLYRSIFTNLFQIEYLYLTGGESLLDPSAWELIEQCYKQRISQNITIHITTNGTVKLSSKQIKMLKSFKRTMIHISIDGVGQMAEYIRTGLIWDKWIKNLERYTEQFDDISVVITVSVYNVFELHKIVKFYENYDVEIIINLLMQPEGLCISNINRFTKQQLIEFYENEQGPYNDVINFLKRSSSSATTSVKKTIKLKEAPALGKYPNFKPYKELFPEYWKRF